MTSVYLIFDKNKFYFYINALLSAFILDPPTLCTFTMKFLLVCITQRHSIQRLQSPELKYETGFPTKIWT